MEFARSIAHRINELRLQRALEQANRVRRSFLREDHYDGDCAHCVRRVRAAEDRVRDLEIRLDDYRAS